MRARAFLLVILGLAVCGVEPWGQAAGKMTTLDAFSDFSTFYYLEPHPERISETIEFLQQAGYPGDDKQAPAILGFYAEVFASNKDRLPAWTEQVKVTTGWTKEALELALQHAKDPQLLLKGDPNEEQPGYNDMCWAAFFASGKDVYLAAIVGRLHNLSDRTSLMRYVTAGSAQWSLSSNARQHPRVKAYLQTTLATASPDVKKAITEALEQEPGLIQARMVEVLKEQRQKGVW
jgi:hypothetical protein